MPISGSPKTPKNLTDVTEVAARSREDIDALLQDMLIDTQIIERTAEHPWSCPWRPVHPEKVLRLGARLEQLRAPFQGNDYFTPTLLDQAFWNLSARHEAVSLAQLVDRPTRLDLLLLRHNHAFVDPIGHPGLELAHGYYEAYRRMYFWDGPKITRQRLRELSRTAALSLDEDDITCVLKQFSTPALNVLDLAYRFSDLHSSLDAEIRGHVSRFLFPFIAKQVVPNLFIGSAVRAHFPAYMNAMASTHAEVWQHFWLELITSATEIAIRLKGHIQAISSRMAYALERGRRTPGRQKVYEVFLLNGGSSSSYLAEVTGLSIPGLSYILDGLTGNACISEMSGRNTYRYFETALMND